MKRAKSISELASSVPRPPALVAVEESIAELRSKLSDLDVQQSVLLREEPWTPEERIQASRFQREIVQRRREIEQRIIAARPKLAAERAAFIAALAAALASRKEFICRGIERDFQNLITGCKELDEISSAIWSAGGRKALHASAPQVALLLTKLVADAVGKKSNDVKNRAA
jgi:hypothetical protein